MKKTTFTILATMTILGMRCSKQDLIPDTLLSTRTLSGALQNERKAIAALGIGIGNPNIKYFGRFAVMKHIPCVIFAFSGPLVVKLIIKLYDI